jgi:hypothetical protein
MAKNVKWSCRELCIRGRPELISLFRNDLVARTTADVDTFLEACFAASAVGRRSVLFWCAITDSVVTSGFYGTTPLSRARAEEVHSFKPTHHLRLHLNYGLDRLSAVKSWPDLFAALAAADTIGQREMTKMATTKVPASAAVMNPSELLKVLHGSWDDGIAEGHFTADTDFGALHKSGGSNLFLIGNRYQKAAFSVDRSGSMESTVQGSSGTPNAIRCGNCRGDLTRFELVATQLIDMLKGRSVDFAFAVVLFDHRLTHFDNGRLVQNTPKNRQALVAFLAANRPEGGTNLFLAVEAALSVPGAMEAFLLTDGEDSNEKAVIARAAAATVPLNCIGVDLNSRGKSLLERIAKAGKGECLMVDAAKISSADNDGEEAASA